MKKRVLAFLMAFTLVMPMFAVSAFADEIDESVKIIYTDDDKDVDSVEYTNSVEGIRSVQAYLADDEIAAEGRDDSFDATTWINQYSADERDPESFPLGLIPAVEELDGKIVTVYSNDALLGSAEIEFLKIASVEYDEPLVTVTTNRAATGDHVVYVKSVYGDVESDPIPGDLAADSDSVVIDISLALDAANFGPNTLVAWLDDDVDNSGAGEATVRNGFVKDSVVVVDNALKFETEAASPKVYVQYANVDGDEWIDVPDYIQVANYNREVSFDLAKLAAEAGTYTVRVSLFKGDDIFWTIAAGELVIPDAPPIDSVKIASSVKSLKLKATGWFTLDYKAGTDLADPDYANTTVTSATETVLSVAKQSNGFVYKALKTGSSIVTVSYDGSQKDKQVIRVVP